MNRTVEQAYNSEQAGTQRSEQMQDSCTKATCDRGGDYSLYDSALNAEGARGEADLPFEHIAELGVVDESGCSRDLGNMHLAVQEERLGIIQAF